MATGMVSRKRKPLDAATEVCPERAREVVRQRFQSELVAVRRLLQKATALRVPRSEEPPAKKIKASSPPAIRRNKVTRAERELLKADLEKFASELPDHIMELLKKLSRAISDGEMEIDFNSVPDEATLELRQLLDKFVRGRENPSPQQHQDGKVMDEDEEDVDIVGGVSPLAVVPAPLQLAEEEDQYMDICGDASPVVMPNSLGISGSPSSSSSCDSDSDSDEDESVDSPAPTEHVTTPPRTKLIARAKESLEKQRKEARCRAREKARQEVLETERTAMPSDTIHPMVLKSLGIDEENMVIPLRRLGLFLKVDDDQEQEHRQIFEEDLEEGEIRF